MHVVQEFEKASITLPVTSDPDIQYRLSPMFPWASCSENSTHVTCGGTPTFQYVHPGDYIMVIEARQTPGSTPIYVYEINFTIFQNTIPVFGETENKTAFVPSGVSWNYGPSWITDPEGLVYYTTITVNGSTPPAWLIIDQTNYSFTVDSTSDSMIGTYTIQVSVTDTYNFTPSSVSFTLEILANTAPIIKNHFESFQTIKNQYFSYQLEDPDYYFTDLGGLLLTPSMTTLDGSPLSSSLNFDATTNILSGQVTNDQSFTALMLTYIVTNTYGSFANTTLEINFGYCFYKWESCHGPEFDE